ncbi:sulfur carrier protein ThiS [Desertivirga brevis]|uniref:sulfur carrier protein ThiS n=1 Tax=Desertivirga brevis TaxID=2810310 RepID=UPI001A958F8C|nr:sulfur carrier protein ThiS [Pedobacter sp. SYSU D00873]
MEIIINQQPQSIPDNYSVKELLAFLMPEADKGIAVAINQQIIPRSAWANHKLHSNDKVMLIRATQGG